MKVLSKNKCVNCDKRANYNFLGQKKGLYCRVHKLENMVDINKKNCCIEGCKTSSSYQERDDPAKQYCGKHRTNTSKMLDKLLCEHEGCEKSAGYGKPVRFCASHKPHDAILSSGLCKTKGCKISATYGWDGKKLIACKKHKEIGMMSNMRDNCCFENCNIRGSFKCHETNKRYCVVHKPQSASASGVCVVEGCKISACYCIPGKKRTHCTNHKIDGMIASGLCCYIDCNIKGSFLNPVDSKKYCAKHKPNGATTAKRLCEFEGCDTMPTFGFKDGKVSYCARHKLDNMIPVNFIKCEFEGCFDRPFYGIMGKKATRCRYHKLDNMVALSKKFCDFENCDKFASLITPENTIRRCVHHKLPDMVRISKKTCEFDGCLNRPRFGPIFQAPVRCKSHKKTNDLNDEQRNPKCKSENGCDNKPTFASEGVFLPTHCEIHKVDGYKNIVEQQCINCKFYYLIPEGNNVCFTCGEFEKIRQRKPKETKIKNLLDNNKITYEYHDEIIDASCSRKRPDFVIDYGIFKVVIEVDEHQHNYGSYNPQCEIDRMIEIHQTLGMDTIFIRFNPDKYIDTRGKKIFGYLNREKKLLDVLNQLKNIEKLPCYLCFIKLFYDGYDNTDSINNLNYWDKI